jgi:hypothetical protein
MDEDRDAPLALAHQIQAAFDAHGRRLGAGGNLGVLHGPAPQRRIADKQGQADVVSALRRVGHSLKAGRSSVDGEEGVDGGLKIGVLIDL